MKKEELVGIVLDYAYPISEYYMGTKPKRNSLNMMRSFLGAYFMITLKKP